MVSAFRRGGGRERHLVGHAPLSPALEEAMTLYERVKDQIMKEGPQEGASDYADSRLEEMSAKELLIVLSYTFNWDNLKDS